MDRRRPERSLAALAASLLVHAIVAVVLFSLATSSSEQSAPESVSSSAIISVSRETPVKPQPAAVPNVAAPVPHAPVLPRRVAAAQPRSAAPHPPVRHELSKFAPTAPPNPTPAPASSTAPNPLPTQAVIAVTPAPVEAAVPTSAPAQIVAATIKVPPTAAPKPKLQPTAAPSRAPQPTAAPRTPSPATPRPEPSALTATAAPIVAMVTPRPMATAGSPNQVHVPSPAPAASAKGTASTPGPHPAGSPGPKGVAPVKSQAPARPIQAAPSPRPAAVQSASKGRASLNQRLQNMIPTGSPQPTPASHAVQHYSFLKGLVPTPVPEPTPPPQVLAQTHFLYQEDVGSQRWKQSYLGTAPEEQSVKMYVTSVKRIGPVAWCSGWVVRSPIAGTSKWIVEPDEHLICSGKLTPFTPPPPEPSKGS